MTIYRNLTDLERAVRDILLQTEPDAGLGGVPRPGIRETPNRVAKALLEWTSGYEQDVKAIFKVFDDGAEDVDGMVIVKEIPFYSHCEHHMAPFFGTVDIGYIPNAKEPRIVGLSKLARLTDIFAHRWQVQERMTNQIANAIVENLAPVGVGVLTRARHLCMESRGVRKQGHHTVYSALRGAMKDESQTRAEFLSLAR